MSGRKNTLYGLVRNFYEEHNRSKLPDVDEIVTEAIDLELTDEYVLHALCDRYKVPRNTPRRSSGAAAPRQIVATGAERKHEVNDDVAFGQSHLNHGRGGAAGRARTEDVLREQVRQWILEVLADAPADKPQIEQLRSAANPVDALRDGVLLVWLYAKLEHPDRTTYPRTRTGGYFSHDNISQFT
eukprot:CAMPEP_0174847530 /NCGR_PEP_ID=MMETSP1114-20130205/12969_1 /TAXON_ID=312471 /ORGANISM="Neobodo designis, Strain CCAP 1951/1" /LENGTH=184 /DNA_ID=CAMNT_0016081811 /DNA_START=73 /DNA_END=623 /DNA_ORIENTATION=-